MAEDEQHKAAFRRWARENHPDVGGDPEVFAAGLQAAREGRFQETPAGAGDRDEEPIPVYVHKSIHGLARVIVAAQKWNARRRRPPRVR
jgi:hypothetical protein